MKANYKTIYTCLLLLGIMCIPYLEGMGFPYSISVFAYGVGMIFSPLLISGIAMAISKLFKRNLSFHNWFNVSGTLVLLGAVLRIANIGG